MRSNTVAAFAPVALSALIALFMLAACAPEPPNSADPYGYLHTLVQITDIVPATAVRGQVVTIKGKNFDVDYQNNKVYFAPSERATVIGGTDTSLSVVVPSNAVNGFVMIQKNDDRDTSIQEFVVDMRAHPPAALTEIIPRKLKPGMIAEIRGYGFSSVAEQNQVWFGTIRVQIQEAAPNKLMAIVPDGVQPDRITLHLPNYRTKSAFQYEVYKQGEPVLPAGCRIRIEKFYLRRFATEILECLLPGGNDFSSETEEYEYEKLLTCEQWLTRVNDSTFVCESNSGDSYLVVDVRNKQLRWADIRVQEFSGGSRCTIDGQLRFIFDSVTLQAGKEDIIGRGAGLRLMESSNNRLYCRYC